MLENFDLRSQLIGFYGSGDGNNITSLGFITNDLRCKFVDESSSSINVTAADKQSLAES